MDKQVFPLPRPTDGKGPYDGKVAFSSGVRAGEWLFLSGQLARGTDGRIAGKGDALVQTRQVLRNLKRVLDQAGATFDDVVKVTVFIKDMADFRKIHDARLEFFSEDHLPASTMVQVSAFTEPEALVEIEAIALVGK